MQYLDNYELITKMYEDSFFDSLDYTQKRNVIEALYKDPDKYDKDLLKNFSSITNKFENIVFSADGLCSWKMLYDIFDGKKVWLEKYKIIRGSKYGEFVWPSEFNNGQTINQEKSFLLGDRIDLTIFDIKRYLNGEKTRMLFNNTYTKDFLEFYKNQEKGFGIFCKDYKLTNVFIDENDNVLDISSDDPAAVITDPIIDSFKWSNKYGFKKRKVIMEKYIENICTICKNHPKQLI